MLTASKIELIIFLCDTCNTMEVKGPTSNAPRDLLFVIIFLIVLGIAWLVTGGVSKKPTSVFLEKTPGPSGNVDIFNKKKPGNEGESILQDVTISQNSSEVDFSSGQIIISVAAARDTDPAREYVEIRAAKSNEFPINISGWTLEGKEKLRLKIPQAAALFKSGQINFKSDVILGSGEKAIVATSRSPVGESFKVNKCSRYLSQAQSFWPSFSQSCPSPKNESWPADISDKCFDYIETLPNCKTNFTHPISLDNQCIMEINKKINYNGCVEAHKSDEDFYKGEWRVYLGREQELWKKSYETIVLRNSVGSIITSVSY